MTGLGAAGESLLDAGELAGIVDRLGAEITRDHPEGVVLVGILKGSALLVADLARTLTISCEIDFLALSAYGSGGTRVRIAKDLDIDVAGKDVVLVTDLVDTGLTLGYVRRLLAERGARSIEACALLDRTRRRLLPVEVRYVGRQIGDEYLVGYGLDLDERYRNLPGIVAVEPEVLRTAPDAMVERLARR